VGVSGTLTGWSAPLGTVNQPPDANRVGMCANLSLQASAALLKAPPDPGRCKLSALAGSS
jgi:hypothetical protein